MEEDYLPPKKIVLEERSCQCGCGRKFKTLPTSRSFYATIKHDPAWHFTFNWGIDQLIEKEEKFLEAEADPNQIEDCYF